MEVYVQVLHGINRLFYGTNFSDHNTRYKLIYGLQDTKTGKELKIFKGHTAGVACVAIAPDGKSLVSGLVIKILFFLILKPAVQ